MNIIEALRTGWKLRRPIPKHLGSNGNGWLGNNYVRGLLIEPSRRGIDWTEAEAVVNEKDLLADDWEVEEQPITITKKQFWDAYADARKVECGVYGEQSIGSFMTALARALGFT